MVSEATDLPNEPQPLPLFVLPWLDDFDADHYLDHGPLTPRFYAQVDVSRQHLHVKHQQGIRPVGQRPDLGRAVVLLGQHEALQLDEVVLEARKLAAPGQQERFFLLSQGINAMKHFCCKYLCLSFGKYCTILKNFIHDNPDNLARMII